MVLGKEKKEKKKKREPEGVPKFCLPLLALLGAIAFQKGLRAERAFTFGYPRHFVAFWLRGSAPFGVLGISSFRLVVRGRVAVASRFAQGFVRSFVRSGGWCFAL